MADYRAALGRGTDSMMGHLTPGEAVIPSGSMTPKLWAAYQEALDRQGMAPEQYVVGSGQNSINPATGQPEFQARVANVHASSRTREIQETNPGRSVGFAREGGSSERRAPDPVIPPRSQIETIPPDEWSVDPTSGNIGRMRTADLSPLTEFLPAPLRVGMSFAGIEPSFDYFDPANIFEQSAAQQRTSLGRESASEQGMSAQRAAAQQSFMRPAVQPSPQFLGLSSAMTPLQQRSAIASRAVAGQGGEFTSPEAHSFYDNLLQRSLIGDDGSLFGLDTLLPIDLQYLAQIRGIENPADTSALLASLQ